MINMPVNKLLHVYYSAQLFQEEALRNNQIFSILFLRDSYRIVTALNNDAKSIIPVADMGEASKIAQNVDSENYLLCGEKDGVQIDGYDLGNSPLDYKPEVVGGKRLIFNTTNGTKAIKKSGGAFRTCIASFLNVSAVVNVLKEEEKEIVLVCAGWKGRLAFEDILLAG